MIAAAGPHRFWSGRSGQRVRDLDDHTVPHVGGDAVIVPWYDGVVPFLGVCSQRVNAAVHGVAVRALVVPRVVRLEVVPFAPHVLGTHLAHVQFGIVRILVEYLVAVGLPVAFDVCETPTKC